MLPARAPNIEAKLSRALAQSSYSPVFPVLVITFPGSSSRNRLFNSGGSGATPNAQIRVEQKKNNVTVFDEVVQHGEQFTFVGTDKGTLGTEISIFVDGVLNTKIHTSCSQPIGPGLISGDFEVIEGFSKKGGPLYP